MPASRFLTLDTSVGQSALRITKDLRSRVEIELSCFNKSSASNPISIDQFIKNFLTNLINKEKYNIVSAFFTYVLEYEYQKNHLLLRTNQSGSLESVLKFFLSGSLIFESLLKFLYPKMDDGSPSKTLGNILNTKTFQYDFPKIREQSASSLLNIKNEIKRENLTSAFSTTVKLRNTTTHNLEWDDIFDVSTFDSFYRQQINSFFYIVEKKF